MTTGRKSGKGQNSPILGVFRARTGLIGWQDRSEYFRDRAGDKRTVGTLDPAEFTIF